MEKEQGQKDGDERPSKNRKFSETFVWWRSVHCSFVLKWWRLFDQTCQKCHRLQFGLLQLFAYFFAVKSKLDCVKAPLIFKEKKNVVIWSQPRRGHSRQCPKTGIGSRTRK
jgi:hypothetical protein